MILNKMKLKIYHNLNNIIILYLIVNICLFPLLQIKALILSDLLHLSLFKLVDVKIIKTIKR